MAAHPARRRWRRTRRLAGWLGWAAVAALVFELTVYLYVLLFPWPYSLPSYSWANAVSSFWVDRDPSFGVWHEPHSVYRHTKSCFTVDYRANSYGARDRERHRSVAGPRTVVLGDSFIEGLGVAEDDRITNRLERMTGIPHLNFGTSGDFGPLQYRLLYETLASRFAHDRVIVGLLPANDFTDDYASDVEDPTRYRPFYRKAGDGWEIAYSGGLAEGVVDRNVAKGLLREFTHSYHVARTLKDVIVPLLAASAEWRKPRPSKFYRYTARELELLYLSLDAIRAQAGMLRSEVVVVLIPTEKDIAAYDPARGSPLGAELASWGLRSGVRVLDLLPLMHRSDLSEAAAYFLPCDAHWSPHGHAVAARILAERVYGRRSAGTGK